MIKFFIKLLKSFLVFTILTPKLEPLSFGFIINLLNFFLYLFKLLSFSKLGVILKKIGVGILYLVNKFLELILLKQFFDAEIPE